jgi:hypothetical protein
METKPHALHQSNAYDFYLTLFKKDPSKAYIIRLEATTQHLHVQQMGETTCRQELLPGLKTQNNAPLAN